MVKELYSCEICNKTYSKKLEAIICESKGIIGPSIKPGFVFLDRDMDNLGNFVIYLSEDIEGHIKVYNTAILGNNLDGKFFVSGFWKQKGDYLNWVLDRRAGEPAEDCYVKAISEHIKKGLYKNNRDTLLLIRILKERNIIFHNSFNQPEQSQPKCTDDNTLLEGMIDPAGFD